MVVLMAPSRPPRGTGRVPCEQRAQRLDRDADVELGVDGRGGAETRLITAAAWDVVAPTTATGPAVYKPGRRRSPQRVPGHFRPA